MKNISHSKIKNTAIVFDVLSRQITVDLLKNKDISEATSILKKYFKKGTELHKEWVLYSLLIKNDESIKTNEAATDLLELTIKQRTKIDDEKLSKEKYNLISAIKEHYNTDSLFNVRISNYKVLAAIYKLFKEAVDDNNYNPTDIVQSKQTIIENITLPKITSSGNIDEIINEYKKQNESIRLLSQKILFEKFNKKYGVLDKYQKTLLREYINNLSNTNSLKKYLSSEIQKIKEILNEFINFIPDKVLKIKLTEVNNHIGKIVKCKVIKDAHLIAMLETYQLINELKEIY